MRIGTFHATSDGGSRFADIELPLALERTDAFGHRIPHSAPFASDRVCVVELPAGLDQDWHQAPERQLVVVLQGTVEVETTDGETRQGTAGACFLADDTEGQGHRTRTVGGPAMVMFVPIEAGELPEGWARLPA